MVLWLLSLRSEAVVLTQCAYRSSYPWQMGALRPHMMEKPPYFLRRMEALCPHLSNKAWFLTRPYVPLGAYHATVFLVGMVVYGQMYVCMFLCIYIFGWMADGWMGEYST